jgi:hypothetical protein
MATEDPLYPWKKHSGFKKGLLTDIVLGDQRTSHGQYETTMNTEYIQKQLSQNEKFAGRSSGFAVSDRLQKHIRFGDDKVSERHVSVTGQTFIEQPLPNIQGIYN